MNTLSIADLIKITFTQHSRASTEKELVFVCERPELSLSSGAALGKEGVGNNSYVLNCRGPGLTTVCSIATGRELWSLFTAKLASNRRAFP